MTKEVDDKAGKVSKIMSFALSCFNLVYVTNYIFWLMDYKETAFLKSKHF